MMNYIEHMNNGFTFNGTAITDPTVEETGRYKIVPIDHYGDAYFDFINEGARLLMKDLDAKYKRETKLSLDEYRLEFEFTGFELELIDNLLLKFND